jgi:hypothetical protein
MRQGWTLLIMLAGVTLSVAVHLSWAEPPLEPPSRLVVPEPTPEAVPPSVVADQPNQALRGSIGALYAQAYGMDGGGLNSGYAASMQSALQGFGGGGTASGLGGGPHSRPVTSTLALNATVASGEPIILGALGSDIVTRIVVTHTAQLRYCYQKALRKNPALYGTVVEKFVVNKEGAVSSAVAKRTTMEDVAMQECIDGRFMRMRFPKPKGGGIAIVSYPLTLSAQPAID